MVVHEKEMFPFGNISLLICEEISLRKVEATEIMQCLGIMFAKK